jgi:hypothetical protein
MALVSWIVALELLAATFIIHLARASSEIHYDFNVTARHPSDGHEYGEFLCKHGATISRSIVLICVH